MRLKLIAAAVMGAAVTAPACAMAGQIIESAPIPTATVPYTYTFQLPSFNSSLGTLTSVEFELTDTATASVVVINTTDIAQLFSNASAAIPLTVTGPGGLSVADLITAEVASGSVAAGQTATFAGVTGTHSADTTFTGAALLAFESDPVVNLSYTANAGAGTYAGTGLPGVAFTGSASAGGTFELIYNYAAVPEPGTWALLMLGVGAIGVAMRRRKDGLALAAA
jgi:hypothetical protein